MRVSITDLPQYPQPFRHGSGLEGFVKNVALIST